MIGDSSLYKEALLEHAKYPRNYRREPFEATYITARGRNPRCGDDVEVGLRITDGRVDSVGFRGRGCSICMASTSMLTEAIAGGETQEIRGLYQQMITWAEGLSPLPAKLEALLAVQASPSRKKCALLGWSALGELLANLNETE